MSSIADGSPIEFEVSGTGEVYLDLANSHLYVKAKITAADGANIAADAEVGPVNNFLHSLFSQVDISLNGTLITSSTNTYPYRADIEDLLSYGSESRVAINSSSVLQGYTWKNGCGKFAGCRRCQESWTNETGRIYK